MTSSWHNSGLGLQRINRECRCAVLLLAMLITVQLSATQVTANAFTSNPRDFSRLALNIRLLEKELLKHKMILRDSKSQEIRPEVFGDRNDRQIPGVMGNANIREFERAFSNYISGEDKLAISGFKSFVRRYPRHPLGAKAEISLAQIYLDWGNYDLARSHFENAKKRFQKMTGTIVRKEPVSIGGKSRTDNVSNNAGKNVDKNEDISSWKSDLPTLLKPLPKSDQFALKRSDGSASNESHATGEALIDDFAINVGDRIFFDTDSSELSPASQKILRNQVHWLRKYPELTLTLEGHSDERGTREYNLGLSARRAAEAAKFLQKEGISGRRIRTISYGKERPIALCNNVSCWAQNRRVITRLNFANSPVISQKKKSNPKKRKNIPEWDANYSGSDWLDRRHLHEI